MISVDDILSSWSGNNTINGETSRSDLEKSSDTSEVFFHQPPNSLPLATSSKIIESSSKDNQKSVTFNTINSYDNTLVRSAYQWATKS